MQDDLGCGRVRVNGHAMSPVVRLAGATSDLRPHMLPSRGDLDHTYGLATVNAEYGDGELITADGEDVRYEMEGYLGQGKPGSFTS